MNQYYKPIKRLNRETNKQEQFIAAGKYANGRLAYVRLIEGKKDYTKIYNQIRKNRKLIMILDYLH